MFKRLTAAAAAVGCGVVILIGTATPAQAASGGPLRCTAVVGSPDPITKMARIESRVCGAPGEQAPEVGIAATRLLMTWYTAGSYGGDSTKIYGREGGCGNYGIEFVGKDWNDKIHSFRTFNNCTFTRAFEHANYGGWCYSYNGDASWVGSGVSSFWLSESYKRC